MFRLYHQGLRGPAGRSRGGLFNVPIFALIFGALFAAVGVLFVTLIVRGLLSPFLSGGKKKEPRRFDGFGRDHVGRGEYGQSGFGQGNVGEGQAKRADVGGATFGGGRNAGMQTPVPGSGDAVEASFEEIP